MKFGAFWGPVGLRVRCWDFVFALETEDGGAGVMSPSRPDVLHLWAWGFYLSSALGPYFLFGLH